MEPVERVDLLLLNASNLVTEPIFPFAFVQVSAVARRFGVKVARFDLVGIERSRWRVLLKDLLAKHQPRMIGVHLRQADSEVALDYLPPPDGDPAAYYLPVDDTRELLREIHLLTRVPVVIGGFGFTMQPLRTARQLAVDFGVQGEPDGFFASFEDVLARRNLDKIPNLVFRQGRGYRANPRVFYPPSSNGDYDDAMVTELIAFYGERPFLSDTPPHVPVEIARGCPCRCYFCNEPEVKGRKVHYRAWSAVEQDLARLDCHGIRLVWLVCSEINIHPKRAVEIARRMAAINRGRRRERRIRWSAYNIPRMSGADLQLMLAAGYEPGWNDFPSFDDRNLARCRVPFRKQEAMDYYRRFLDHAEAQPASFDHRHRKTFFLFLGNAFSDARTIRSTLQEVERYGLQARHTNALTRVATRVFETGGKLNCGASEDLVTLGRKGKQRFDIVGPTYLYPPALLQHLGGEQAVREFLGYVSSTFLSTAYEETAHWSSFLAECMSLEGLRSLMRAARKREGLQILPVDAGKEVWLAERIRLSLKQLWSRQDPAAIRRLLFPGEDREHFDYVAQGLLIQLLRPHARAFKPVLRFLKIPHDRDGFHALSPYALARILYRQYDSNATLVDRVCQVHGIGPDSLDLLALRFLLHESNVQIRPEYQALLFDDG